VEWINIYKLFFPFDTKNLNLHTSFKVESSARFSFNHILPLNCNLLSNSTLPRHFLIFLLLLLPHQPHLSVFTFTFVVYSSSLSAIESKATRISIDISKRFSSLLLYNFNSFFWVPLLITKRYDKGCEKCEKL
jgi:hypothetical protein